MGSQGWSQQLNGHPVLLIVGSQSMLDCWSAQQDPQWRPWVRIGSSDLKLEAKLALVEFVNPYQPLLKDFNSVCLGSRYTLSLF